MAETFGAERTQGTPYALDAGRFAGVRRAVQPGCPSAVEPGRECLRRIAALGTGQSKRHHALVAPVDRDIDNEVGQRQVRVEGDGATRDVEDPAQLDTIVVSNAAATT